MAWIFLGSIVLGAFFLLLEKLAGARHLDGGRQTQAVLAHLAGTLLTGGGAMVWFDYTYIEDFDQTTERYALGGLIVCAVGVGVILAAWTWALRGDREAASRRPCQSDLQP